MSLLKFGKLTKKPIGDYKSQWYLDYSGDASCKTCKKTIVDQETCFYCKERRLLFCEECERKDINYSVCFANCFLAKSLLVLLGRYCCWFEVES